MEEQQLITPPPGSPAGQAKAWAEARKKAKEKKGAEHQGRSSGTSTKADLATAKYGTKASQSPQTSTKAHEQKARQQTVSQGVVEQNDRPAVQRQVATTQDPAAPPRQTRTTSQGMSVADDIPVPNSANGQVQQPEQPRHPDLGPHLPFEPNAHQQPQATQRQAELRGKQRSVDAQEPELDPNVREQMRLAEYHGKLATELTLGTGRTTAAGAGELVKRAKTSQRKLTEVEQDLRQAPGASQPQTRTIITQQLAGIGNTEQRFDPILQSDEQKLRRYKEYASGPLDSAARSRIDKAEEAAYKVKTKLGPAAYAALERGDTAYSNAPVYRKAVDARVYAVDPASRPPQTLDQAQSAGMEMGLERTLNT